MRVATFNANSIRARMPVITAWLDREKPDILCLQETKVQDEDFPSAPFKEAGYHIVFKGQKAYNGVAIASKEPASGICSDLCGPGDEQARFICAVVGNISIVNVYVPQGFAVGSDKFGFKLRWLRNLYAFVDKRYTPQDSLIVTGDFNVALEPIDLYDPGGLEGGVGFHPEERALMQRLLDWGLVDVFRRHNQEGGLYTFWDYRIPNAFKRKMGWRIDYILAPEPLAAVSSNSWIDTEPRSGPKPSDHTFLVAEFE